MEVLVWRLLAYGAVDSTWTASAAPWGVARINLISTNYTVYGWSWSTGRRWLALWTSRLKTAHDSDCEQDYK